MSYIGRGLDKISNVEKLDNITFDGSTTYALTINSGTAYTPVGKNNILISIDGVMQQGNFTVSTTNIVFDWSPTSSNTCDFILHYGVGVLNVPADDAVSTAKIQDGAITAAKIADGTVVAAEIASNAVTTAKINADAVTGAKIADDAIDSEHYTDGSIDNAHIADDQIDSEHYAADSIDAEHYAPGSVDATALASDAVTTAKILDDNVTAAKMADNSIDSDAYVDASIDTAHIADAQITTAKLSTAVLTGATDIGGAIADADLFLLDDGAGGTLRKSAMSRVKTYVGGGVTEVDQWRLTTDLATAGAYITANWERIDGNLQDKLGTGMSESSGVFTFPSTGIWYVTFNTMFRGNGDGDVRKGYGEIAVTTDNSSYASVALSSNGLNNHGLDYDFGGTTSTICDVTNTTNHKVKFYVSNSVGAGIVTMGSSTYNKTFATFIRLSDT